MIQVVEMWSASMLWQAVGKQLPLRCFATNWWTINNKACKFCIWSLTRKTKIEASQSGKFPKRVEIRTTHAFVLRHHFGNNFMKCVQPISTHKLEDIIATCTAANNLPAQVSILFPNLQQKQMENRIKTIASTIRRTVMNFETSIDEVVNATHVPFLATQNLTERTAWKANLNVFNYVAWAQEYFDVIQERCEKAKSSCQNKNALAKKERWEIPHDSYIKVAQLKGLSTSHDVVLIDEAQDMSPCQASLFWGDHIQKKRITYLFGDRHQQLYRFRGARDSFGQTSDLPSTPSFSLTGSFRFGKNIASISSLVLSLVTKERLQGRLEDPGIISDGPCRSGRCSIVLCRSNNGILRYLHDKAPKKWCFLDKGKKPFFNTPPRWVLQLEGFLRSMTENKRSDDNDESSTKDRQHLQKDMQQPSTSLIQLTLFNYQGETFTSIQSLKEYAEEESDKDLLRWLDLLLFLKKKRTTLLDFQKSIGKSYIVPENLGEYDGTVVSTVHMAKGFEFENVTIYNDFNVDTMVSMGMPSSRRNDEINAFYVALTRSQKRIFLCESVGDFIRHLQSAGGTEDCAFEIHPNVSPKDIREKWESDWDLFQADTSVEIKSIDEIPWPMMHPELTGVDGDHVLPLDPTMTEEDQRRFLRRIVLSFHPDKFLPHFGVRIRKDNPILLATITNRLRCLNAAAWGALKSLRSPVD